MHGTELLKSIGVTYLWTFTDYEDKTRLSLSLWHSLINNMCTILSVYKNA